jgi:anaerobic magnesium-protoporphyrin IX monomethyl ester cyclase
MNALIIHLNPLNKTFQFGLAYIASFLKKKGHSIAFLSLTDLDKKAISEETNKTEIVLISVATDSFRLCQEVVKYIKTITKAPIILGGIHPTICPEECISVEGVNGICVGEGEHAITELMDAIAQNKEYSKIDNLWIKDTDGRIHKNQLRPLIKDLDTLPFPDYGIFKGQVNFSILPVILSRGCPFNCTYCCNHTFRKLYKGKGSLLRNHSIEYSIKMIDSLLKQFPFIKEIEFYDDTFTIKKQWLRDFLKEFSKFKIKFICNSRFDVLDEEVINLLSEYGCVRINAAIESGNEKIRKDVLGRFMPNSEIIEKGRLVKAHNIHLHTHNMVGIPYEKEENILETIELNRTIKPDSVVVSVFNPYPKTVLGEICFKNEWLSKKIKNSSYFDFTVLESPFISHSRVNYYFLVFSSMVFDSGPTLWIKKCIFWLMHLHNNFLYIHIRNVLLKRINSHITARIRKLMKNT